MIQVKSFQIWSVSWYVFSCIQTKYIQSEWGKNRPEKILNLDFFNKVVMILCCDIMWLVWKQRVDVHFTVISLISFF